MPEIYSYVSKKRPRSILIRIKIVSPNTMALLSTVVIRIMGRPEEGKCVKSVKKDPVIYPPE